ncbi:MAG: Rid family detoxifying hydrolase [Caldilineaceae bacterium]|nr:Rid family detoxifying hydrolase [Caldilineaceae bacterium]
MRQPIQSDKAPKPRGPYTPAIVASGPTVYISAQGPLDPATNLPRGGTFTEQAEQVFQNVTALLEAAGSSWAHAVKVTVYLADFADFAKMNEVYLNYVTEPYPARTTVHSRIGQSEIAVDCIALVPEG